MENGELNTVHDFNTENRTIMILGGLIILKKPLSHFIFSILYIGSQFSLYGFLLIMTGYTMIIAFDDKITIIRALNSGSMVLLSVVLPSLKHIARRSLNEATSLIKGGIFKYENEEVIDTKKILKTRVSHIRLAVSVFTKLLTTSAVVYIFLLPLMQLLTVQRSSLVPVNPYLPLPLYMPFNTMTYLGYSLAFLSHAAFYFYMFMNLLSMEVIYLSCALQFMAQVEILNFSLMEIERRAVLKLMKMNYSKHEIMLAGRYNNIEFQSCLNSCLKENILHHHEILRLKKAVSPCLEGINSIAIVFFSIILASCIFLILEEPHLNMAVIMEVISEIMCYFFVSLIGDVITDKSNETAQFLYSTPWVHCDENFKCLLKIMASNLKRPIILKSTGFKSCSLETFGDMLSAAYKIVSILG